MMKKIAFVSFLLVLPLSPLFGKTTTISLYVSAERVIFSSYDLIFKAGNYNVWGVGLRGVSQQSSSGFYWGADLSLGSGKIDNAGAQDVYPEDEGKIIYTNLKVPLGKRWPGKGKKTGFFIGGGPQLQGLFHRYPETLRWEDSSFFTLGLLGFFGELGFQTNKTKGIGFHIGLQAGGSYWKFTATESLTRIEEPNINVSLQIGISWRRSRD